MDLRWNDGEHAKALLWEEANASETDRRYYPVWGAPSSAQDVVGVHASVGSTAYHEICAACGGFSGKIRFKVYYSLEEAIEAFVRESQRRGQDTRADFYGH